MRRKMLGAILLPLPFAALPVIVVLIGAVFGPGESDELVTRDTTPAIVEDFVSTEAITDPGTDLASVTSPAQFEPGCNDFDALTES